MLLATELLTTEERESALAEVPWRDGCRWLAVGIFRATDRGVVDMIDAAVGTPHARAILVALHEGVDRLIQAVTNVCESKAAEQYFARAEPQDPIAGPIEEPVLSRMRIRLARLPVETAILQLAAAGNDLVNSHVRLAWEAGVARADEMQRVDFDPADDRRTRWATVEKVRTVVDALDQERFGLLREMALTGAFRAFASDPAVIETRDWRDQLAHRERMTFAESPAFGRTSVVTGSKLSITLPKPSQDDSLPTIAARRQRLAEAGEATFRYAEAIRETTRRFFDSVGIGITDERAAGQVRIPLGWHPPARELRDPVPFLRPAT